MSLMSSASHLGAVFVIHLAFLKDEITHEQRIMSKLLPSSSITLDQTQFQSIVAQLINIASEMHVMLSIQIKHVSKEEIKTRDIN